MALPSPSPSQAYCDVSALEAGIIELPLAVMLTNPSSPDAVSVAPSLSFILHHSADQRNFVFDLGIRKDWQNYPPKNIEWIKEYFPLRVPQDVVESLAKGGTSPSDISTICLSHLHFDHVGDTKPFTESTFVVGGAAEALVATGYPGNPNATVASDLLPSARTKYLSPVDWQPLGPFPRALDFYEDGSLYIVDAPGHLPGHVNILARTSSDGAWIYLAGDSAHHWDLLTGKSGVRFNPNKAYSCAHHDKAAAEEHISRIRALLEFPRIRVLLAHDEPWYDSNKGGPAFWPGKIPTL